MTNPTIAIVSGAAGGIGRAVATALAGQGARVVITDLDAAKLDEVVAALPEVRDAMLPIAGDLLDPALGPRLVTAALQTWGGLGVVVNAAGWLKDQRIQQMPPDLFRRLVDLNFVGAMRLIDAATAPMKARGYGRIVSIGSRAYLGNFGSSGYSCAKGAISGASRSLALALAPYGITVNCIAPGFIDTPMARSLPAPILDRVLQSIPVGRPGRVDDIAALALYLTGVDSGYMTGQTLLCCGGRSLSASLTPKPKEMA